MFRDYPGWGTLFERKINKTDLTDEPVKHQLDRFRAIAISGNDLMASVLYTTGQVAGVCGPLTPIVMLLACLALYPFRF